MSRPFISAPTIPQNHPMPKPGSGKPASTRTSLATPASARPHQPAPTWVELLGER